MKKLFPLMAMICFLFYFSSDVYSQGKWHDIENAGVTVWSPDDWKVSREHILLLLMPKPETFKITFEPIEGIDLDKVVMESIEEIKIQFPQDTLISPKDIVVDQMNGKEIHLVTGDNHIVNYILIVTPANKILKAFLVTTKAEFEKYKSDVEKIKNAIKRK